MPSKPTTDKLVRLIQDGHTVAEARDAVQADLHFTGIKRSLNEGIGSGDLMLSDFYFATPNEVREDVELLLDSGLGTEEVLEQAEERGWDEHNVRTIIEFRDRQAELRGDMYRYLSYIERTLADHVQAVLVSEYGEGEDNWWAEGVPVNVRIQCAETRERDPERLEPWRYLNFIHLRSICDNEWRLFKHTLPKKMRSHKSQFLSDLGQLNQIRNAVMHPVKRRDWTRSEFAFVRSFHEPLEAEGFRPLPDEHQ